MLSINIPGYKDLNLHHALIDYNGTLAVDGKLISDMVFQLNALSQHMFIHIVTGDGFGTAKSELSDVNCTLTIVPAENQGQAKHAYLQTINPNETVVIGNGRNDCLALKEAALGIVVLGEEGTAREAILSADLVMPSIFHALELLQNPKRLIGTLRS